MSLFSNGMGPADIAAVTGGNNNGWGDGNGCWWILVLLLAMNGGWGNNGFGGGNGLMWPYFFNNTDNVTQRGFDTAAITGQLSGINAAVNAGFSNSEVAACNRAMDAMQTSYNNQIASMNQSFANAQALDSRLDSIGLQLQNCCCENRQNIADLKYTVAQEGAATRSNTDAKVQTVLDKLCQLEIDNLKSENTNLRSQLNEANRLASQTAQNAFIAQGLSNEVDQLYNRLSNCPVPSIPVYGRQPIFSCANNSCGCGCA